MRECNFAYAEGLSLVRGEARGIEPTIDRNSKAPRKEEKGMRERERENSAKERVWCGFGENKFERSLKEYIAKGDSAAPRCVGGIKRVDEGRHVVVLPRHQRRFSALQPVQLPHSL